VNQETWDWRSFRSLQGARVTPFVKWAGGKSQLLEYIKVPARFRTYHEPFLGGGAVFFALQPRSAFLSDVNDELTNAYKVVKERVEKLISVLKEASGEVTEDDYYEVRARDPASLDAVDRAARFIFLNKTCYNGLYRVNRDGKFNVPFGRYRAPRICDAEGLRLASEALQHAIVKTRDFKDALKLVEPSDVVYLNPPYVQVSRTSRFTEYTNHSFDWSDQVNLATEAARLRDDVGCVVLISNSYNPKIEHLYRELKFHIRHVTSPRVIGATLASRVRTREILASTF